MKQRIAAILILFLVLAHVSCSKSNKPFEAGEPYALQGNENSTVYMFAETQCANRFKIFSTPDSTRQNVIDILTQNNVTVFNSISTKIEKPGVLQVCTAPRFNGYIHHILIFKTDTVMAQNIGLTRQE